MQRLTSQGQKVVRELAERFEVSIDAVLTLLEALVKGRGTAAQFSHPELGGPGQWMKGGMTQVGDLFNHALRAKVDSLCTALSARLATERLHDTPNPEESGASLFVSKTAPSSRWWPEQFGTPGSVGEQNDVRYAYFADKSRLVVDIRGAVTVHDTLHHRITGFSHQQGTGGAWLLLTSQDGRIRLTDLPVLSRFERGTSDDEARPSSGPAVEASATGQSASTGPVTDERAEILATIERLHELRQNGALTDDEFAAKKAELLRRL